MSQLDVGTLLAHLGVDTSSLKGAGRVVDDFANKSERGLKRTEKASMSLSRSFGSLRNIVASLTAGYGLYGIAGHFINTAKSFEQMQLKLGALSRTNGVEILERINAWAKEMPVNTQEAVKAFAKMQAMGLDPTVKKMETLVDVSILFGEEALGRVSLALGQMSTMGKLWAQDLNQLAAAGINARKYLLEAFGIADADMINKAGLDIQKVIKVIMTGLERDFGGAAKKAMNTWQGINSLLESSIIEIERKFATAGVFQSVKDAMKGISDSLNDWLKVQNDLQSQGIPNWFDEVAASVRQLSNDVHLFAGGISKLIGFAKGIDEGIKGVVAKFESLVGIKGSVKDFFHDLFSFTDPAMKFWKALGMVADKAHIINNPKDEGEFTLREMKEKYIQIKEEYEDVQAEISKIGNSFFYFAGVKEQAQERAALLKKQLDNQAKMIEDFQDRIDMDKKSIAKDKNVKSQIVIPDYRSEFAAKKAQKEAEELAKESIKIGTKLNSELKKLTMERLEFYDWETEQSLAAIANKYGKESELYTTLAAVRVAERRNIVKDQLDREGKLQDEAAQDRVAMIDQLKNREMEAMTNQFEARRAFLQREQELFIEKYANDAEMLAQFGETYNAELSRLDKDYSEWLEKQEDEGNAWAKEMENMFTGWGNSFAGTLNDMLWGSKFTFAEIAKEFGKMITQMAIQKGTAQLIGYIGKGITSIIGGGASGNSSGSQAVGSAMGNIFGPNGLKAFADGGIVTTPTLFPFANGGVGLMGEAGYEGIFPVGRTSKGELGVKAVGANPEATNPAQNNITIMAIDSKSFADMVRRNPAAIITVVEQNLQRRGSLRSTINQTR